MKPKKVGEIDETVIRLMNLSIVPDAPILLGEQNIQHMKEKHPEDFEKYGDKIREILNNPDYIAKHPRKPSIEYIKIFYDDDKDRRVLVAVRATTKGIHFARTLFEMSDDKVKKYEEKGAFYKYIKTVKEP